MSDRADTVAQDHVRVLTNDAGTWGIDLWGTWFPCDGDTQDDVEMIAQDVRDGIATGLRAYAEEARRETWLEAAAVVEPELAMPPGTERNEGARTAALFYAAAFRLRAAATRARGEKG